MPQSLLLLLVRLAPFRYITEKGPNLSHLHLGNGGSKSLAYQITLCHNLEGHYKCLYLIENFKF